MRRLLVLVAFGITIIGSVSTGNAQDQLRVTELSRFGGLATGAAVSGDMAVLDLRSGLVLLDLSGPAIEAAGWVEMEVSGLVASGETGYVVNRSGLVLLDLSVTGSVSELGSVALTFTPDEEIDLAVTGDLVWVIGSTSGLKIVDVSEPTAPVVATEAGDIQGAALALENGLLVTIGSGRELVRLYDVATASEPQWLADLPVAGARNLAMDSELLLVTGGWGMSDTQGLVIYDLEDVGSPERIAEVGVGELRTNLVEMSGSTVFLDARGTLLVLDVSDGSNPQQLGQLEWGQSGYLSALIADSDTLFLCGAASSFSIMDVSEPQAPTLSREYRQPEMLQALATQGSQLWIATSEALWRYDLTNPASPVPEAELVEGAAARRLIVDGNRAVTIDGSGTVTLFDLTEPDDPLSVAVIDRQDEVLEMALVADVLYLLDLGGTLEAVDVSDPAAPVSLGELQLTGPGTDLATAHAGDSVVVCIAGDSGGLLEVIDVSDPRQPAQTGVAATSGQPARVVVENDQAYVCSNNETTATWYLEVFELPQSGHPLLLDVASGTGALIWDVEVADDLVAASLAGLGTEPSEGLATFELSEGWLAAGPLWATDDPADIEILGQTVAAKADGTAEDEYCYDYVLIHGHVRSDNRDVYGTSGASIVRICGGGTAGTVGLFTDIFPAEAKAAGCTVSPPPGLHEYQPNEVVPLSATPAEGWSFTKWTGDASGSSPTTTVLMDGNKFAYAHFAQPVLTLQAQSKSALLCAHEVPEEGVEVMPVKLCVDEDADWQLRSLEFTLVGMHKEETLDHARLVRPATGEVLATAHPSVPTGDGPKLTFGLTRTIAKGQCLALSLQYVLDTELLAARCGADGDRMANAYGAQIKVADIAAVPLNPPYEVFTKLPAEEIGSASLEVACVRNTTRQVWFYSISGAVAADLTRKGDLIEVCPGTYWDEGEDGIEINERLTIRSTRGAVETILAYPDGVSSGSLVTINADGVRLSGFTFAGGKESDEETLSALRMSTLQDAVIADNVFRNAGTGLFVEYPQSGGIVRNNSFVDNNVGFRSGGFFKHRLVESTASPAAAAPLRIEHNQLTGNGRGLYVADVDSDVLILANTIRSTSGDGIVTEKNGNVTIRDNLVEGSGEAGLASWDEGITVVNNTFNANCKGIVTYYKRGHTIVGNKIDGNTCNTGIELVGGSGIIRGNSVTDDAADGIRTSEGATATLTDNNISGNVGYGLRNQDPTVTIDARSNWWGAASGPGGSGPGNGDEVSDNVDFSGWRAAPVDLVVDHEPVLQAVPAAGEGRLRISARSWQEPDGSVTIDVTDTLGWTFAPGTTSLVLEEERGSSLDLGFVVPVNATPGETNQVEVRVTSATDSTRSEAAAFTVTVSDDEAYRVPVVAHTSGFGGTAWRSDLAVANLGDESAVLIMTYHNDEELMTRRIEVAPGAAAEWRDVLVSLLAVDETVAAAGSLAMTSDVPLVVTSRTYADQGASGTYGQQQPALVAGDGLGQGETGILPLLAADSAFYTNIGLVNLGGVAAGYRVTLVAADGSIVGSELSGSLQPGRWTQLNDVFSAAGAGAHSTAFATVELTTQGGTLWAYASVIDRMTRDPTTIPVQVAQSGTRWIAGVAHVTGYGGLFWRSAAAVVNPGSEPAEVALTFRGDGVATTETVTVSAATAIAWRDLVVELFGVQDSVAGALEIDSQLPIAVSSRIYADLGQEGTYGQLGSATPAPAALSNGEIGCLPLIHSDERSYTNIGAINPSTEPATIAISLFDENGDVVGSPITAQVAAGRWYQVNKVFEAAGAGLQEVAYAVVEVTSTTGAAWFYASVIDRVTRDPTTIPVHKMRTPNPAEPEPEYPSP